MLLSLALLVSAVFGASGAAAAVKAPPKSVLVLKATWNPAGITPGSSNWIPTSSLASASQGASDRLRDASQGFFSGWSTTVRGPFQITAPRADSQEEETFQIGCGTQFFSDLTSRTDAAARAAGLNPDAADLVIYAFDDPVCASMPDNVSSAALIDSRRIALEGETSPGNIAHMVGHYMGLGHASSLRCTNPVQGPVPLEPFKEAERCVTNPNGNPYDLMGSGLGPDSTPAGTFNAAVTQSLGWLGDEVEGRGLWNIRELDPTRPPLFLEIASISDPLQRARTERAIRVQDGSSIFWIEYRTALGADAGLRATPGLLVHREVGRDAAGAPITKLLDMSPSTPMTDAGLPIGQSWASPVGNLEIGFDRTAGEGFDAAVVKIGPKPGRAPQPLPHPVPPEGELPQPARSMLVINVGWNAPSATNSAPLDLSFLDKTAAMINSTMNTFYRRSAPPGHYLDRTAYVGGSSMIPIPRLPSGKPLSACDGDSNDADRLKEYLYEQGEEVAENAGFEPSRFAHLVVVYSRSFCGYGGLERDSTGDIQLARRDPGAVYHEFGHYLGLNHAEALQCHAGIGVTVTLSNSCARVEYGDEIDPMGAASLPGTFGPINAKELGWMDDQFYNVRDGFETVTRTIKPFGETVPDGRKRAIKLVDGSTTLWLDYRAQVGADRFEAPPFPEDWGFNPEAVEPSAMSVSGIPSGLYVHREVHDGGISGDEDGAISQLIDMTPQNGFRDSALQVGQTWANPIGVMQITVNSVGPNGATVTISRKPRPVTVPNLEEATEAEAKVKLEALGLVYGGVIEYVDDCSGTMVGEVVRTVPSAGTNVALGTAVSVKIGQKPRQPGNCQ